MATFTSPSQLNSFLNKQLIKVIDYLTDKIEWQLRHNIDIYTYQFDYFPNEMYLAAETEVQVFDDSTMTFTYGGGNGSSLPSFEFRDSFYKTKAEQVANNITGWVVHDAMSMSPPSARYPYLHGNFKIGEDRRRQLASLLNVSGKDKGNDFGGKKRQPFFDITIKWIEDNFKSLVKEAFSKVGLQII